ncbi:CTB family bacteriocin [Scytonema sp. NUACC26]|uniref:CTB family bacteriocin n=1 Tax=Scytonema sp. NUACC26 TaxID=3140176 RepID=UPI0034DC3875
MSNEILFTDLSIEQQEVVAGGKKVAWVNDTIYKDSLDVGPLLTVANDEGASVYFGGFIREIFSNAYLDLSAD